MDNTKQIEKLTAELKEMRENEKETVNTMNQIEQERNVMMRQAQIHRGKEYVELDARRANVVLKMVEKSEELAKLQPQLETKTETETKEEKVPENK